jgi:signal transduction histidine kinase
VKEYIAFREPIPEERWYLAVVRTETPLLAAFHRSQMIFLLIIVFGLIIATAGTFYISKKITTPISQLAAAAEKVAQGDLDLNIAVASRDEIGELAADFNKMATDLKQHIHERQANETLLAVGRFSAALAHDLRNPVEGLKLLSRELGKRVDPHRPEHEIADTIVQSVDRLSSLVNQSLDFARLNQPVFVETDLAALADEVLQDFRFGEVELQKDYAHDLPLIKIDAMQIKRVLSNLLRNAIEACLSTRESARCQIRLALQADQEMLRIEIADTGPGIPAEIREKIFDPFFSTKPGGHGLGLALARQIIANHGGTIAFASDMGEGTRFVIELPIAKHL